MKKCLLFICLIGFFILNATIQGIAQGAAWINSAYVTTVQPDGNGVWMGARATAIDNYGNAYAVYQPVSDIVIGGQVYPVQNSFSNAFLVKYAPNGTVLWVKQCTGTSGIGIGSLQTDRHNNIYLTGYFWDSFIVDSDTLVCPTPQQDYFLTKWDSGGNLVWGTNGGAHGSRTPTSIAIDKNSGVILSGYYSGFYNVYQAGFGPVTLATPPQPGHRDLGFLVKYSAGGEMEWVKSTTHQHEDSESYIEKIAVDGDNNIYFEMQMTKKVSWGNFQFSNMSTGINDRSNYWVKCDSLGNPLARFRAPVFSEVIGHACMAIDSTGSTYVNGAQWAGLNIGPVSLPPSNGSHDMFILKYSNNGIVQWGRSIETLNFDSYLGYGTPVADGIGNLYITGIYKGSIKIDNLLLPVQDTEVAFVAVFDVTDGSFKWAQVAQDSALVHSPMVATNTAGDVVFSGGFRGENVRIGNVQSAAINQPMQDKAFLAKLHHSHNTIAGQLFIDTNLNGILDSAETGYPGQVLLELAPGPVNLVTTGNGFYQAATDTGSFSVSIPNPPLYYSVVAAGPATANFASYGNTASGLDFALQPRADQQDVRISLTPYQPCRPGFTVQYRITYTNTGTVAIPAGEVTLQLDPLMSYDSSSHVPVQTGNLLTWNYTNLQPAQSRNIDVFITLAASAVLGDSVVLTAGIEPLANDLTPPNNTEVRHLPIVGSFDPNEIEVNLPAITQKQAVKGQWLEYTIRFQNMGTDTAFTVVLRDSLSSNRLLPSSLEVLASSHPCKWSFEENSVFRVEFNNILLPHQTINNVGSNGFLRYRIKPAQTVQVDDVIPNQAKIYFDFNPYIATNTAITKIARLPEKLAVYNQLGADTITIGLKPALNVFPNPFSGYLICENYFEEPGFLEISMINLLGQEVIRRTFKAPEGPFREDIHLQNLPNGMYLINVRTDAGIVSKALVKQ